MKNMEKENSIEKQNGIGKDVETVNAESETSKRASPNIPNIVNIKDMRLDFFDNALMFRIIEALNVSVSGFYIPSSALTLSSAKFKDSREGIAEKRIFENNGLVNKVAPKKTGEKDTSIMVIVDESEKHKDKLDDQKEAITLKMDGFEKVHLEQYEKQLAEYKRFLAEYLAEARLNALGYNPYDDKKEDGKRNFEWGQEVVTYSEIKDIVRRIHMNALLSGNSSGDISGHNSVSWQEVQDYKFWKYCSKFNEMMSFVLYDLVGSGG